MLNGTRRPLLSVLALVATTALLAGCFSIEATFTINDDATAEIDYLVLIDTEQLGEIADLLGEDAGGLDGLGGDALLQELTGDDDPCADLTSELTDYDVSTREIDDDGQVGVGCTVSGVPIEEISSLGDDTSSFSIEQDADGTSFDAVLEGVDELTGTGDDGSAEIVALLGLELDDLFTIRFVVTAPGSLGDNNATSTDGATATWVVTPDAEFVVDGDATMSAQWTPGDSGGSSTLIILIVIALVIAAAIVAFLLVKRSKRPSDAPEAAAGSPLEAPAASATPPPPPPPPPSTPDAGSTPPPPPPPPSSSSPPPPPAS